MPSSRSIRLPLALGACLVSGNAAAVDYVNDIQPIMEQYCWNCHSYEKNIKGNLALDDLNELEKWRIGEFNIIRRGKPEESSFLGTMNLDPGSPDFMPRKGQKLPQAKIDLIEQWIKEGAIIDAGELSETEQAFLAAKDGGSKPDPANDYLKWTNKEGKTIEARFQRIAGDKVALQMRNGVSYTYSLADLSPESQAQARKLAGR